MINLSWLNWNNFLMLFFLQFFKFKFCINKKFTSSNILPNKLHNLMTTEKIGINLKRIL